jgi:uncharacterized protein (TIGR01777 family)
MKITIFGATGFIGKELVNYLLEKEHTIHIITRDKEKSFKTFGKSVGIYDYTFDSLLELTKNTDVIINLAGENISGGLWTKKRKQKIIDSRIRTGNLITSLCEKSEIKPKLIIQASAIGYYGYNTPKIISEQSFKGEGFLAEVCDQWESSTEPVIKQGIKRSIIRTGIVLGNSGGILPKLLLPFKFCVSVLLGSGKNYLSWIHLKDEIRAIEFILKSTNPSEIYNLTTTTPVTMRYLMNEISKHKRFFLRFSIPDKILSFIMGDMAREMLLANQQVIPSNLIKDGFHFEYQNLNSVITDLLK